MYDITIDVDGVLLDIHTQLKHIFSGLNIYYDENDVYTYNFNAGLPDIPQFTKLPPRNMIYDMFKNPALYRKAPADWDSILLIRRLAERGYRFLIYTISSNLEVFMVKQALFTQWFALTPNIDFESIVDTGGVVIKGGKRTHTVIEDSHINLREYSSDTLKFLVDKPYNKSAYNLEYDDVFSDKNFHRCGSTYSAIMGAIKYVDSVKTIF